MLSIKNWSYFPGLHTSSDFGLCLWRLSMNLLRCHWRMLMLLKLAHYSSHVRAVSAFCEWQVQCQVRLFCYFRVPFCVWSEVRRYGCCSLLSKPYLYPNLTGWEWTLFLCWIRQRTGALIFSSIFSSQGFPFSRVFLFLQIFCCDSFGRQLDLY